MSYIMSQIHACVILNLSFIMGNVYILHDVADFVVTFASSGRVGNNVVMLEQQHFLARTWPRKNLGFLVFWRLPIFPHFWALITVINQSVSK